MNKRVRSEYGRLRKKGWPAKDALRAARVKDAFDDLENAGLVKFEVLMDPECHDASYVDTWIDKSEAWRQRTKREIRDRADQEGTWGIVTSIRASEDAGWEEVDSVWDFVGDDWKDSGYDTDVMNSAVDAVQKKVAA